MKTLKNEFPVPALAQGEILCGDDFSENSVQAAQVAGALAKKLNVRLTLTHVVERSSNDFAAVYDWARYFDGAQRCLRSDAARLSDDGVQVNQELPVGLAPAEGILRTIIERRPSLVMLSSVSKSAWGRWTLGSVAEEVVQFSPAPTLVLRDPFPLLEWIKRSSPLKVFIAFDFSDASAAALRWATQLQAIGDCKFTLGYVDWPPAEKDRFDGYAHTNAQLAPELRWKLEHDLKQKVESLGGPPIEKVVIDSMGGRPDYPLVSMAISEAADLIILGSLRRHGFERLWHRSISRSVLAHAPMNVIVVPSVKCALPVASEAKESPSILVPTGLADVQNRIVAQT